MTNTILFIIIAQMVIIFKKPKKIKWTTKNNYSKYKIRNHFRKIESNNKNRNEVIQECVDILSNENRNYILQPFEKNISTDEKAEEIFNKMEFIKNFNNSKKEIVIHKYLNRVYF